MRKVFTFRVNPISHQHGTSNVNDSSPSPPRSLYDESKNHFGPQPHPPSFTNFIFNDFDYAFYSLNHSTPLSPTKANDQLKVQASTSSAAPTKLLHGTPSFALNSKPLTDSSSELSWTLEDDSANYAIDGTYLSSSTDTSTPSSSPTSGQLSTSTSPSQSSEWICNRCNPPTTHLRRCDLNKHIKNRHSHIRCPLGLCQKTYKSESSAKRHVQTSHEEVSMFFCLLDGCDQAEGGSKGGFTRRDALARHMKDIHPNTRNTPNTPNTSRGLKRKHHTIA